MSEKALVILGYHSIGPPSPGGWKTWFYVPEAIFVEQLCSMTDEGWEMIDLATLLNGLKDPGSLPERASLITFDDGYRSTLHVALPILRELGHPAVLFVPTDFIGRYNTFEPEGWAPREPICSWDDLRLLEQGGISVQSHGAGHRKLSDVGSTGYEEEIHRSKAALEAELRSPVGMFSYPYGDAGSDPAAASAVLQRAGYQAACRYDGRVNILDGSIDPFHLSRLQMGPDTDLRAALQAEVST